jgi:hypothetical protein
MSIGMLTQPTPRAVDAAVTSLEAFQSDPLDLEPIPEPSDHAPTWILLDL